MPEAFDMPSEEEITSHVYTAIGSGYTSTPFKEWKTKIRKEDKLVTDPETGALKADGNKNQLELLPFRAIEQVGLVLTYGASKYSAHNWRKGFEWTRLTGAAMRHLFAFMRGEDLDPESGISHLAHSATNILFLLEMILTNTGNDDRYQYSKRVCKTQRKNSRTDHD